MIDLQWQAPHPTQSGLSFRFSQLLTPHKNHQGVGDFQRSGISKREVIVYDYVDGCVPVPSAMNSKRVRGYEAVGYQIKDMFADDDDAFSKA